MKGTRHLGIPISIQYLTIRSLPPEVRFLMLYGLLPAAIQHRAQQGEEIQRFEGRTDWVRGTSFSPDGCQIISASGDGTVRLWSVVGVDLLEWIENNRYVRDLTLEEWQQYRLLP